MHRLTVCATALLSIGVVASAQNILNNGGFEFGLMCLSSNIWSNTSNNSEVSGKGDYRLKLSPDAHSGSYSLEISCNGTDCPKAAAISNRIPTAPGQSYRFRVQTKCPARATATVYIPGTSVGDHTFPLKCTGNWAPNTFTFRMAPGAHDFFFYLFSYNGAWVRFDDVVLTYGDGSARAPISLHAGNRNVETSNRTVLVDGAPYLALGFFDVNYADLPQVAALGANTVFGLGGDQNAGCYNTTLEGYQDRAYDLGLNFVPDSTTTARLAAPDAFPRVLQKFAPHLANIAWMLSDEPDQASVPTGSSIAILFLQSRRRQKRGRSCRSLRISSAPHGRWLPKFHPTWRAWTCSWRNLTVRISSRWRTRRRCSGRFDLRCPFGWRRTI